MRSDRRAGPARHCRTASRWRAGPTGVPGALGPRTLVAIAALVLAAIATTAEAAITVDGIADEPEWQDAQRFDHFVVTQPYSLATPDYPAEARIVGTPEGIAVAITVQQPAGVPRQHAVTARDADIPGDRVNLFIDFNADGVTAYNFTVGLSGAVQDATLTNENSYSTDWDGEWQHAVHEEKDAWSVEMLIPWSVAQMKNSDAPTRTVAVLFDRVLGVNSQRSASAPESFERARFVSNYPHVEIRQFQSAQFHYWPYVSGLSDLRNGRSEAKAGVDLVYKPSGNFQLAAALNPDFGQVESDDLVVNFDAIETFFSDKRPFFTENQGFFDLQTTNNGQLVYTRRIGGPRDDGTGAADIDAAVKLIGSSHGLNYGLLTAVEAKDGAVDGRSFYAQRLTYPIGTATLGYFGSYVDRPFLDRRALVNGADLKWLPNERHSLTVQVAGTDVSEPGNDHADHFEWLRYGYTPPGPWRYDVLAMHYGNEVDFNDLGYMPRASLNRLNVSATYVDGGFPAESRVASRKWFGQAIYSTNDHGQQLPSELYGYAATTLRSGVELDVTGRYRYGGIDDLISRGHGDYYQPARAFLDLMATTPRRGDWIYSAELWTFGEGLSRNYFATNLKATRFFGDRLSLAGEIAYRDSNDWLIWREDTLFGRYHREMLTNALALSWQPADRHELRAKAQWLTIAAHDGESYRLGPDQRVRPSEDPIDSFTVRDFGVQLRYRWTFAEQSDFYAVYSRGGQQFEDADERSLGSLFTLATHLRTSDQFLVKLRYRF